MASLIERVTSELRRLILSGEIAAGERVRELEWAPELGVSRTPLRLALVELEKQGLVERLGARGYHVRSITMDEVAEAIDVRGVLEGFAARLAAEVGLRQEHIDSLNACVREGSELLDAADAMGGVVDAAGWGSTNARFHATLVNAASGKSLQFALAQVTKSPLADAGALGVNGMQPALELQFLQRAQADHEDVLQAIVAREGARAEALMREHARRSRDNKVRLARQVDEVLVHEIDEATAAKRGNGASSRAARDDGQPLTVVQLSR